MALNFPTNPTLGQIYIEGDRSFIWNGVSWLYKNEYLAIKTAIANAINNAGGSITTATPFHDYPAAIESLGGDTGVTINGLQKTATVAEGETIVKGDFINNEQVYNINTVTNAGYGPYNVDRVKFIKLSETKFIVMHSAYVAGEPAAEIFLINVVNGVPVFANRVQIFNINVDEARLSLLNTIENSMIGNRYVATIVYSQYSSGAGAYELKLRTFWIYNNDIFFNTYMGDEYILTSGSFSNDSISDALTIYSNNNNNNSVIYYLDSNGNIKQIKFNVSLGDPYGYGNDNVIVTNINLFNANESLGYYGYNWYYAGGFVENNNGFLSPYAVYYRRQDTSVSILMYNNTGMDTFFVRKDRVIPGTNINAYVKWVYSLDYFDNDKKVILYIKDSESEGGPELLNIQQYNITTDTWSSTLSFNIGPYVYFGYFKKINDDIVGIVTDSNLFINVINILNFASSPYTLNIIPLDVKTNTGIFYTGENIMFNLSVANAPATATAIYSTSFINIPAEDLAYKATNTTNGVAISDPIDNEVTIVVLE